MVCYMFWHAIGYKQTADVYAGIVYQIMQNVGKGCFRIRREKDYTYICLHINRCIMSKTYVYVYAEMQFDRRATSVLSILRELFE